MLASVHAVHLVDLRNIRAVSAVVGDVIAASSRIDALIHVAGVIGEKADIGSVTEADWDRQIDINLKSTFFLNREIATIMAAAGGGAIVNFASQAWWTGSRDSHVVYAASKAGVVALTKGLARTFAERGVRVNAIAPGVVDTGMTRIGLDDAGRTQINEQIPLGRIATSEEMASIALFLISSRSSYITGATVNASGGLLTY